MSLHYGMALPQGWAMELTGIKDYVQAYETMTRVAQTAEECGYESIWLVNHFHTIPGPSQEVTLNAGPVWQPWHAIRSGCVLGRW